MRIQPARIHPETRRRPRLSQTVLALFGMAALAACSPDKELGEPGFVQGFVGGVAADEPRAALAGRDILGRGGTAADAATAMYFMLTVSKPSMTGLGAVGGCVYYEGSTKTFSAIDFMPKPVAAPANARPPIAAPAAVRGMAALQARFGVLPWAELIGPAEAAARFGHRVSRSFASDLKQHWAKLSQDPNMARIYAGPDGGPAQEGDVIEQLALAGSLAAIRQRGAGALYQGPLANAFLGEVAALGGDLPANRLRNYRPRALDPILRPAGGQTAAFLPMASTGGPQQARLWRILGEEGEWDSARDVKKGHLLAEASVAAHAAYAKVARAPGADLDAPDDDAMETFDKAFQAYDDDSVRAVNDWMAGVQPVPSEVSGTSVVALDSFGGAAACGYTLFGAFGVGRLAPGTGIAPALAPPPGVASSSVGPIVVGNRFNGDAYLALAGSGSGSASATVAVMADLFEEGRTLNEAMTAPRLSRGGGPKTVFIEDDYPTASKAALEAVGYEVENGGNVGLVNGVFCERGVPARKDLCAMLADQRGAGLAASAR